MDTALVVAIVIGVAQIIVQLASTRWQIGVARELVRSEGQPIKEHPASTAPARASRVKVEDERAVPLWAVRLVTFAVNTVAVYFLYAEYQSAAPVTRAGVVFISSMVGVVCICFLIPIISGVYDYVISSFRIRGL